MNKIVFVFILIFFSCQNKIDSNIKVGIQPYADFSKSKTDTIAEIIHTFYGVETIILPNKSHHISTFTKVKSPRYRADKIIKLQKEELADSLDYIIGLTEKDISTSKKQNG